MVGHYDPSVTRKWTKIRSHLSTDEADAMCRLNQSISHLPVSIFGVSLRTMAASPVSVVNSLAGWVSGRRDEGCDRSAPQTASRAAASEAEKEFSAVSALQLLFATV